MANSDEKWYFSKERLENSPSRQCGIENYKELSYRQQAANFIQDMGQKLKVSQLCINTAIVYMHRFYVFHSFTQFPWASIASASIFLAAKVEEQPRKLENVIKCANLCKNPHENTKIEINSERYQGQSQDLVFNENILLQTLGFDVAIDHPHTHVVRCCHLVRASKDLAQTSYFMASNSLHLTTMCLQYKPTVVACFCIHLVCKWSNWEIPLSNEKREWFSYVDNSVTADLLKQLTEEFLTIFERCPSRLKEKIMAIGGYSPFETEKKLATMPDMKEESNRQRHDGNKPGSADDSHKQRLSRSQHDGSSSSASGQQPPDRDYRDKREADRMARHSTSSTSKPTASGQVQGKQPMSHGHHRLPGDPKLKLHNRPPSTSSVSGYVSQPGSRPDMHRDLLREATRDIGLKDYRDATDISKLSGRDLQRELQQQKRDMLKNVSNDGPFADRFSSDNKQQRGDMQRHSSNSGSVSNRQSLDPNKISSSQHLKHESSSSSATSSTRHHENEIKKHLNSAPQFLNKSLNTTSRKMESPFTTDNNASKSVPKVNSSSAAIAAVKQEPHNGSSSSSNNNSNVTNSYVPLPVDDKLKIEIIKDETQTPSLQQPPVVTKKPSLFSPEKSPPPAVPHKQKTPPLFAPNVPPPISPFNSAELPVEKRNRTVSSSSEPELRLVMNKIDQVEGFENLLRDPSVGIKVNHQVPDIITPIPDRRNDKASASQTKELSKELKPPDLIPPFANPVSSHQPQQQQSSSSSQPIMNGIETNPTLISNLLKESHGVSHLPTITSPVERVENNDGKDKDHHKERKKKNKEKHKHKDKTRNKEDKEKKKKHKEKDREKHKEKGNKEKEKQPELAVSTAQPIKITIPKDKIQPPEIKIKIPKNRLKPDTIGTEVISTEALSTPAPLKIKISKDVINNYSNSGDNRKRERDKNSPRECPPPKLSKSSHNRSSDSKQNGRSSYHKVSQLGDGETSVHRLAESKYINKGAPT